MKKAIFYLFIFVITGIVIAGCTENAEAPHNLVANGNAELPKYDSVPPGWVNVQGHWVSPEGDSSHHDCSYAQSGKYLFFAGNDTLGILQQDVDISEFAPVIDANKQQFIFNGYVQSLDQGPNSDQAQIIVTGLNNSKQDPQILYNSDTTRSLNKWMLLADTFKVPSLTRFVRIQLVAIRHVGGDNDGYFDNISLIPLKNLMDRWVLFVLISAGIILGIAFYLYIRSKKHEQV
jgi:hypothetical protein